MYMHIINFCLKCKQNKQASMLIIFDLLFCFCGNLRPAFKVLGTHEIPAADIQDPPYSLVHPTSC